MTPVSKRKPPLGRPVIGIWAGKKVHDCATVRYHGYIPLGRGSANEWQAYRATDGEGQEWDECNPPTHWMEFGEVE